MKRPMKRHDREAGLLHAHRVLQLPRGKGLAAEAGVVERREESEGAVEGRFALGGRFAVRWAQMGTKDKQLGQRGRENGLLRLSAQDDGHGELSEIGVERRGNRLAGDEGDEETIKHGGGKGLHISQIAKVVAFLNTVTSAAILHTGESVRIGTF